MMTPTRSRRRHRSINIGVWRADFKRAEQWCRQSAPIGGAPKQRERPRGARSGPFHGRLWTVKERGFATT